MVFVTMPGIGGSRPDHWQCKWESEIGATRFELSRDVRTAARTVVEDVILSVRAVAPMSEEIWAPLIPGRAHRTGQKREE